MVNISSIASRGQPLLSAYGAAKAGLDSLTRSMAMEWGRHGIRVNNVAPGTVNTPRSGRSASNLDDPLAAAITLGRRGTPTDIADACVFLLSDLAAYITGQTLDVDGGPSRGAVDEHDLPTMVTNPRSGIGSSREPAVRSLRSADSITPGFDLGRLAPIKHALDVQYGGSTLDSIDDRHLDVFAVHKPMLDHLVDGVRLGEVVEHGVVAPGDHRVEGIEHRDEVFLPFDHALVMEGDIDVSLFVTHLHEALSNCSRLLNTSP